MRRCHPRRSWKKKASKDCVIVIAGRQTIRLELWVMGWNGSVIGGLLCPAVDVMKFRWVWIFLFVIPLVVVLWFVVWTRIPFLPFYAVYHDGSDRHQLYEKVIPRESHEAFEHVLIAYRQPYWISAERILIVPKLYFDRELRWNYTSRAEGGYPPLSKSADEWKEKDE